MLLISSYCALSHQATDDIAPYIDISGLYCTIFSTTNRYTTGVITIYSFYYYHFSYGPGFVQVLEVLEST